MQPEMTWSYLATLRNVNTQTARGNGNLLRPAENASSRIAQKLHVHVCMHPFIKRWLASASALSEARPRFVRRVALSPGLFFVTG